MKELLIYIAAFIFLVAACTPDKQEKEDSANSEPVVLAADTISPTQTPVVEDDSALNTHSPKITKPVEMPDPSPSTASPEAEVDHEAMLTAPDPPQAIEEVVNSTPQSESPATGTISQPTTEPETPLEAAPKPISQPASAAVSHDSWDKLLQQNVSSSGKVNYKGFKANKAALQTYLDLLSNNPPQNSWSRNEKLAFWINAYNAFTVKLIVDNYPTPTITQLEGGKPWNKRWIKIGDQTHTLDEIENKIIRPRFKEPRIHFAVNCASVSCPELLNRAYTASKLNQQLESQTRKYINNPKHNTLSASNPQVSQLFEWYAVDFTQNGSIIPFLNKYSDTQIHADAQVSFKPYNWNLNE